MGFWGIKKSGDDGGFESLCGSPRLSRRLDTCETNLTLRLHTALVFSGKRRIRAKAN